MGATTVAKSLMAEANSVLEGCGLEVPKRRRAATKGANAGGADSGDSRLLTPQEQVGRRHNRQGSGVEAVAESPRQTEQACLARARLARVRFAQACFAQARLEQTANKTGRHRAAFALAQSRPPLTKTFDVPEIEAEFISYCQLTSHGTWTEEEAEERRLELLRQVADHVHLADFDSPAAAHDICGTTLLEPLATGIEVDKWIDSRSIYAKLCATRLLTVEEERSVMRRMHYFKHRAWQILSESSVSEWDLARAEGLVKAAKWHRDLVVQANMRLIVSIVKKLPIQSHWYDELISDGIVALLRAVDKFDPSRGYRFCTFATTVIRRDCYHYIKQRHCDQGRYKETASLPVLAAPRGKFPGDGDASVQVDRTYWLDWRDRLSGMMSLLTRREQVIIRSRYCLGSHRRVKTLQRLSVALKISKERVRQIELEALAKLRAAAETQMY